MLLAINFDGRSILKRTLNQFASVVWIFCKRGNRDKRTSVRASHWRVCLAGRGCIFVGSAFQPSARLFTIKTLLFCGGGGGGGSLPLNSCYTEVREKSTITSALFPPAEQFSSDRPAVEPDFNACTVFLFFPFFIRRPKYCYVCFPIHI